MAAMVNRLSLACLAVLLLASTASARQAAITPESLVATYTVGHRFGYSSLTIERGGRYSTESRDCTTQYFESGAYVLAEGVLHFTVSERTAGRGEQEVNLLDPNELKELYGDREVGEINREYKLLPVSWSGRVYLIHDDEVRDFANAVNFGLEPRAGLSSEHFFGAFYLRNGDERKGVTGGPALPGEWASFLLSKPLTATIVSVEGGAGEKFATVNKGSRDGLRVGMRLLAGDEEPSLWSGAEVVSVGAKSARVRIGGEPKSGDKLGTRFVRRGVYR